MTDLKRLARIGKVIAMQVRNEMEDFHVQHLSDEQMRQLNPIIRNAIHSALVLLHYAGDESKPRRNRNAIAGVSWLLMILPKYWEEAELTDEVKQTLRSGVGAGIPEEQRQQLAAFCREYLRI